MAITKNSFLKITPITPDIGGTDTTTAIARTFTHRVEDLTTLGVYFDGQLIQADTEPVLLTDAKFYYTVSTSMTTVTTGAFVSGDWYQIKTVGDTNFTLIGAASNTVGVAFIATGAGGGTTGTAYSLSKTTPGTDTITITIKPNSVYVASGYSNSSGGMASFATNVMTLNTAPTTGSVMLGQTLTAAGITAGTTIISLLSGTLNVVGSTYSLSTTPGTVANESFTTGITGAIPASVSAFLSSDNFVASYYYDQYTVV